jgi:hypothetical protein
VESSFHAPHSDLGGQRPGRAIAAVLRATAVGATALAALASGLVSQGCGGREALGVSAMSVVSAGVLNDPSNKSLRFDLLTYGMDRFCVEMSRRGAPLKLSDRDPVLGRFFAEGCSSRVLDDPERQSVVLRFSGKGYGYTNLTGRLGFTSTGLVEYAADFQLADDSMYIYFRPRSVGQVTYGALLIESAVAQTGLGMSGVNPEEVGKDIVERQLARGFTVIRRTQTGEVEYTPGLLPLGQHPFKPYQVSRSSKLTVDNDRTEIFPGQQDFVGGLHVADADRRLFLNVALDGAPAADLFVVAAADAQLMLQAYVNRAGSAPLPRAPLLEAQVDARTPLQLALDVPPGDYFLVFDHSPSVGRVAPAPGQQAARLDYLVQLGER